MADVPVEGAIQPQSKKYNTMKKSIDLCSTLQVVGLALGVVCLHELIVTLLLGHGEIKAINRQELP